MGKTKTKVIERAIEGLNIVKIHKFMEATEWKWASCNGMVPSENEIRDTVRESLEMLMGSPDGTAMTSGGFWYIKHSEKSVSVVFALCGYTVEPER